MGVAAARAAALPERPSNTQLRLAHVWRCSEVSTGMCEATVVATYPNAEEPGAQLCAMELLPHDWLHRHEQQETSSAACAEIAGGTNVLVK